MTHTKESVINELIKGVDTNVISDGDITFGELYDERVELFVKICEMCSYFVNDENADNYEVWRTQKDILDTIVITGVFILGINKKGKEGVYCMLDKKRWDSCTFSKIIPVAKKAKGLSSREAIIEIMQL